MDRQRAANAMQRIGSRAKSAYAKLADEENSDKVSKYLELGKAKAQSLFSQVQGKVEEAKQGARARRNSLDKERSSTFKPRSKSAGAPSGGGTTKDFDADLISKIMEIGVSPVAARLALSKSEGVVRSQRTDVACNWLLEEKNRDEIEAAENDEIEKSVAGQMPPSGDCNTQCEDAQAPLVNRSPCKRRFSTGSRNSDDGRGLGFFMRRKSVTSQPSPRKVPHPGRLSRDSSRPRLSTGTGDSGFTGVAADIQQLQLAHSRRVSIGSQTSEASEEFEPEMTPRGSSHAVAADGDEKALFVARDAVCGGDDDAPEIEEPICDDAPKIEEDDEEEDEDEDSMPALKDPLPPASTCWDWPLSRYEKRARVDMLEKQLNAMDRQELVKECKQLRGHLRKASLGGGSNCTRPSRLST